MPSILVMVVLAAACAGPAPSVAGPHSKADPSTAAPSHSPTPPADLQPSTTVERDGIEVTMELDRNPMPAGEPSWLTTTVRNTGEGDVIWAFGGCATLASVYAELAPAPWRTGIDHRGLSARFKRELFRWQRADEFVPTIRFLPAQLANHGDIACADLESRERVAPGAEIQQRARWDGLTWLRLAPPPSGPIELVGRAGRLFRDGDPDAEREGARREDQEIELRLDAWITGGPDDERLDPPEVADAALADAAFVDMIFAAGQIGIDSTPILWFDPASDVWEVGLVERAAARLKVALVDPRTGDVIRLVDRPWNPVVDGDP